MKQLTKLLDIEVMGEVVQFGLNMFLQDTNLHCKLQRCTIAAEVDNRLFAAIFPALHVTPSPDGSYHVTVWWLMQLCPPIPITL